MIATRTLGPLDKPFILPIIWKQTVLYAHPLSQQETCCPRQLMLKIAHGFTWSRCGGSDVRYHEHLLDVR